MQDTPPSVPYFTQWPSFPFEGDLRVKQLDDPVSVEPPRKGEGNRECTACNAPDDAYIWVGERWRVRAMDRPTGLPMVLILESRSHLDLGDLPNLLAAELGVMTVRLERAIRSLDGVARVHVNRWGDGSAHLHLWFLARPHGRLQLRGTFLSLWDSILPPISEDQWRENLAMVAAWLAEFGGRPLAEPPRIRWQAPSSLSAQASSAGQEAVDGDGRGMTREGGEVPVVPRQRSGTADVVGGDDLADPRDVAGPTREVDHSSGSDAAEHPGSASGAEMTRGTGPTTPGVTAGGHGGGPATTESVGGVTASPSASTTAEESTEMRSQAGKPTRAGAAADDGTSTPAAGAAAAKPVTG